MLRREAIVIIIFNSIILFSQLISLAVSITIHNSINRPERLRRSKDEENQPEEVQPLVQEKVDNPRSYGATATIVEATTRSNEKVLQDVEKQ